METSTSSRNCRLQFGLLLILSLCTILSPSLLASGPLSLPLHLNAGGNTYVDPAGNTWLADTYFNGGTTRTVTSAIFNAGGNQSVYKSQRLGEFSYIFSDLPNGTYTVNLKFAELT